MGPIFELQGRREDAASDSKAESPGRRCARKAVISSRRTPHCKPRAAIRVTRAIHATESDTDLPPPWSGVSRIARLRASGWRACAGEDADEVRLQIYARRWDHRISEPVQQPPVLLRSGGFYVLN